MLVNLINPGIEDRNEEREAMNNLANEMAAVQDVFIDMALLVDNQGETIENIQTSIDNTNHDIIGAKTELLKAKKYQKGTRMCMCRIMCIGSIILLIIIIIFITIPISTQN